MLDEKNRIHISEELFNKAKLSTSEKYNLYYDEKKKELFIDKEENEDMYFIRSFKFFKLKKICITPIKVAFPSATYLPAIKNGKLYILIIT